MLVFGLSMAGLFGAVVLLMGHLSDRDPDHWPATKDVVGCWSGGGWQVTVAPRKVTVGDMALRATDIQRIKNTSFLEVEPFNIVGHEVRKATAESRGQLQLTAAGSKIEKLRLIDTSRRKTPWLARC